MRTLRPPEPPPGYTGEVEYFPVDIEYFPADVGEEGEQPMELASGPEPGEVEEYEAGLRELAWQ